MYDAWKKKVMPDTTRIYYIDNWFLSQNLPYYRPETLTSFIKGVALPFSWCCSDVMSRPSLLLSLVPLLTPPRVTVQWDIACRTSELQRTASKWPLPSHELRLVCHFEPSKCPPVDLVSKNIRKIPNQPTSMVIKWRVVNFPSQFVFLTFWLSNHTICLQVGKTNVL